VDDSAAQRLTLAMLLRRAGYVVEEAADGETALAICRADPPDVIVSDWMMPGMSGPDLCRAVRALGLSAHNYFILLTSRTGRDEVARGLEEGADDYLTKPVNAAELRARITAGLRLTAAQKELSRKNALLGEALDEVRRLYGMIDAELVEAHKLQHALVRDRICDFGPAAMATLLRSAGHVGGDLVGHFRVGKRQVGLFSLDVSGHGISSALMTARLAGLLSTAAPQYNVALTRSAGRFYRPLPTNEVVARLNDMMMTLVGSELYFTMVLAIIDIEDGRTRLTQAGHPHPLLMSSDGSVRRLGAGGLPVGLIDNASWDEVEVRLHPGDRLLICSDGVTECPGADGGQMLDEAGLALSMQRGRDMTGPAYVEALLWDLARHHGDDSFPDDVSAVLLDFHDTA